MNEPLVWWGIAAGGALGALVRATSYSLLQTRSGLPARWRVGSRLGGARATLLVNVAGSFLLGLAIVQLPAARGVDADPLRILVITGFCGSLTTFSTFCADAVGLARSGQHGSALAYLIASAGLSLAGLALGLAIGG